MKAHRSPLEIQRHFTRCRRTNPSTHELQSGGETRKDTSAGAHTEKGKTVSLLCEGDTTEFAVDDDGALIGPPDGMLGRLTKEKR